MKEITQIKHLGKVKVSFHVNPNLHLYSTLVYRKRMSVVSPRSELAPLKFASHVTQFAPLLTKIASKVDRVRPTIEQAFSLQKGCRDRT